jgi:hypothetical protein
MTPANEKSVFKLYDVYNSWLWFLWKLKPLHYLCVVNVSSHILYSHIPMRRVCHGVLITWLFLSLCIIKITFATEKCTIYRYAICGLIRLELYFVDLFKSFEYELKWNNNYILKSIHAPRLFYYSIKNLAVSISPVFAADIIYKHMHIIYIWIRLDLLFPEV